MFYVLFVFCLDLVGLLFDVVGWFVVFLAALFCICGYWFTFSCLSCLVRVVLCFVCVCFWLFAVLDFVCWTLWFFVVDICCFFGVVWLGCFVLWCFCFVFNFGCCIYLWCFVVACLYLFNLCCLCWLYLIEVSFICLVSY